MKFSVGIPVYDSRLHTELVTSLLTEKSIANQLGCQFEVLFLRSCTNLAMGRNQIVRDFLATDSEKLVFIDADVTFEPGALVKLAHYPVDLVGGVYPLKAPHEAYPIAFATEEIWSNALGLIEVKMAPTGFLSMSRKLFSDFKNAYPGREYDSRGQSTYCYFQIPYANGALYTEDSYFCEEYRKIGGKVFVDPEMALSHWDANLPYHGHLGNYLRRVMREEKAKSDLNEIVNNSRVVLTENAQEIAKNILNKGDLHV
jgi:hypothetical protein